MRTKLKIICILDALIDALLLYAICAPGTIPAGSQHTKLITPSAVWNLMTVLCAVQFVIALYLLDQPAQKD